MELRLAGARLGAIGGVLLAACLGSTTADAGDGKFTGNPPPGFRPVFDLYPTQLKVGGTIVKPGSSGTEYFDASTPFFPYQPVGLECDVTLEDPKWQSHNSNQTYTTKLEVHKWGANDEGVKVAEHIVSTYSVAGARSGEAYKWLWHPTEPGRYTFTCTADSAHEVDETNEHNNVVGQSTFFVLFTSVPADALKIRITSPTPGQVYDSPADTVDFKVDPVLPDWRAEHVHMEVLKWDRSDPAHPGWVGMPTVYNQWYGSLPPSERDWGLYMVRATSSTSGKTLWGTELVDTPDDTYDTEAEPVFFWIGKPQVDVAAVAKSHLPLPQEPHLKKGVPVKPLSHEMGGQKTIKPATIAKLHVSLQGSRMVGQKLALAIVPPVGAAGSMQVECLAGPCLGQRWSGTTTRMWTVPGHWLGHPGSYQLRVRVGELQETMRFDLSPSATTIKPAAVGKRPSALPPAAGKQPPGVPPPAGGGSTFDPNKAGGVHLPR